MMSIRDAIGQKGLPQVPFTYPPVNVQQIDVVGLQLGQRVPDRHMQTLLVVARVVHTQAFAHLPASVTGGIPEPRSISIGEGTTFDTNPATTQRTVTRLTW
jgi:hypothetical protein